MIDKIQTIKITLIKSLIGRNTKHKKCALCLGLKKINQTVEVIKSRETLGMINKINYMIKIMD